MVRREKAWPDGTVACLEAQWTPEAPNGPAGADGSKEICVVCFDLQLVVVAQMSTEQHRKATS